MPDHLAFDMARRTVNVLCLTRGEAVKHAHCALCTVHCALITGRGRGKGVARRTCAPRSSEAPSSYTAALRMGVRSSTRPPG